MKYIIKTDVGVVRKENQDRAGVIRNKKTGYTLLILCDGMGGHTGGSYASESVVGTFLNSFERNIVTLENSDSWFSSSLSKSLKLMEKLASKEKALLDMGTTLTCAIIFDDLIKIFNIGDSRTYVYNGFLYQITRDHNLRNHYIDKFNYSEEEAATILGAAALTSALGPTKKTTIETFQVNVADGVKDIILTSDGIHDYISKPFFESIIGSASLTIEQKADKLISSAIHGKSSDNLTVIIAELEDK